MSRLKMTKQEEARAAEAAEATADLTTEERKAQVEEVAAKVAEDVKKPKRTKKDMRPKNANETQRRTPGQESMHGPAKGASDPLQGVTVDPDLNYPKILNVLISIGDNDERPMDEFIDDVRTALMSQANAKLATVLLAKYSIDGKHILSHHYDAEVDRLQEATKDE